MSTRNRQPQFWGSGTTGAVPGGSTLQSSRSHWNMQSRNPPVSGYPQTHTRAASQAAHPPRGRSPRSSSGRSQYPRRGLGSSMSMGPYDYDTNPMRSRYPFGYPPEAVRGMVGLKHLTEAIVDNPTGQLDLEKAISVTDEINQHKAPAADTVLFVLYVRIKEKESPEKLTATLNLMDICVKNCGLTFARHINSNLMHRMARLLRLTTFDKSLSARVTKQVNKLLAPGQSPLGVPTDPRIHAIRRKVLTLIQNWSDAFMNHQDAVRDIHEAYRTMRASGIQFPPRDSRQRFLVKNAENSPAFDPSLATDMLTDGEIRQIRDTLRVMTIERNPQELQKHLDSLRTIRPRLTMSVERLTGDDQSAMVNGERIAVLLTLNDQIANGIMATQRQLSKPMESEEDIPREAPSSTSPHRHSSTSRVKLPPRSQPLQGQNQNASSSGHRLSEEMSPTTRIFGEMNRGVVISGDADAWGDGSDEGQSTAIPSLPPPRASGTHTTTVVNDKNARNNNAHPTLLSATDNLLLDDTHDMQACPSSPSVELENNSTTTKVKTESPSGPLPTELVPTDLDFFFTDAAPTTTGPVDGAGVREEDRGAINKVSEGFPPLLFKPTDTTAVGVRVHSGSGMKHTGGEEDNEEMEDPFKELVEMDSKLLGVSTNVDTQSLVQQNMGEDASDESSTRSGAIIGNEVSTGTSPIISGDVHTHSQGPLQVPVSFEGEGRKENLEVAAVDSQPNNGMNGLAACESPPHQYGRFIQESIDKSHMLEEDDIDDLEPFAQLAHIEDVNASLHYDDSTSLDFGSPNYIAPSMDMWAVSVPHDVENTGGVAGEATESHTVRPQQ